MKSALVMFCVLVAAIAAHAGGKAEKATFKVSKAKAAAAATAAKKVAGVSKAEVKGEKVQVTYDPSKTNVQTIAAALSGADESPELYLKVNGMR